MEEELIHKVSRDVRNYYLEDIVRIYEAFTRIVADKTTDVYKRVEARATRPGNIQRYSAE